MTASPEKHKFLLKVLDRCPVFENLTAALLLGGRAALLLLLLPLLLAGRRILLRGHFLLHLTVSRCLACAVITRFLTEARHKVGISRSVYSCCGASATKKLFTIRGLTARDRRKSAVRRFG